jgi:DNA-binding transcriptional MerR regulator
MSGQFPLDFADGKDPGAFRTIGEVAQAFGLRQHVLRYWEEQFPMLKPLKRAGGRRYYRPEDIRLVSEISRLLYQEGFTIRGARQALRVKGQGAGAPTATGAAAPGSGPEVSGAVGSVGPGEPERPGEELERTEAPHPPDAGGEVGARLRRLRDQLADALRQG